MPEKIKIFFNTACQKTKDYFNTAKEKVFLWKDNLKNLFSSTEKEEVEDETVETTQEETAKQSEEEKSAEPKIDSEKQKTPYTMYASPLFHFFDMIASLCFFAALVIALKPELLVDLATKYTITKTEILEKTLCLDFSFIIDIYGNALLMRNLFVIIAIGSFILLKIIAFLATTSPMKIVSFLLLALSVLTCIFVKDHFSLFLIFIILLYFTFQFSCGVNGKTIWTKFLTLIILFFIEYFVIHFVLIDGLLKQFAISGIHW